MMKRQRSTTITLGLLIALTGATRAQSPIDAFADGAVVTRPAFSQLRIFAEVAVPPGQVTFGDVLSLSEADPRLVAAIRDLPAASDPVGANGAMMLSHGELRERLASVGVNMALVTLTGARVCRITAAAAPGSADAAQETDITAAPVLLASAPQTPAFSTPTISAASVDATRAARPRSGNTLADAIEAHVARELAQYGGEPEIAFGVGSEALCGLMAPTFTFNVRSVSGSPLGTRTFRVEISRDGQPQREVSLIGHVRLIRPVVVAERPLNLGQVIAPLDVRIEERAFDQLDDLGLAEPGAIIGQQAARFMRVGELVKETDVKRASLVRRSQRIKLVQSGGGVHVEFVGSALEAGAWGDTIRVRIGETRGDRRETLGRVIGPGRVELVTSDA